ncbi:MAG: hypothetical protein ACOC33_00040 [bacterium]
MKKLIIGFDVNEVLRSFIDRFDFYYEKEFKNNNLDPKNEHGFKFLEKYVFNPSVEINNILHPNVNKDDVYVEKVKLTPEQVFNKFLYEDYTFEIFGGASAVDRNTFTELNLLYKEYKDIYDFKIVVNENEKARAKTLFFLSKYDLQIPQIIFVDNEKEIWKNVDIYVTANPNYLNNHPIDKIIIKYKRDFNSSIFIDFTVKKIRTIQNILKNKNKLYKLWFVGKILELFKFLNL